MTPRGGAGGGDDGITVSERGATVPAERRMARQAAEVPSEGDEKVNPASSHAAEEVALAGSAAGMASAAAGTGEGGEETKKEVARRTPQDQVASAPAPFSDPLPPASLSLPAQLMGVVGGSLVDAARLMVQLAQMEATEEQQHGDGDGDGEEEVVVVPRPGRRRYRPGVRKEAGGRIRRVN